MRGQKNFAVEVDGLCNLGIGEIWSSGSAPENPTTADVVSAMEDAATSAADLIREWNLPVEIRVDGEKVNLW